MSCVGWATRSWGPFPGKGTQEDLATSDQSGAALLTNLPQEVLDVSAEDQAEIQEAVAYANVGVTTSLAIGLGQLTHTTLGSRSESDLGCSLGGDSAPAASEFPQASSPWSPKPVRSARLFRDPSHLSFWRQNFNTPAQQLSRCPAENSEENQNAPATSVRH